MRQTKWIFALAAIVLFCSTAGANTINDPQIIVRDANPGLIILTSPILNINLAGQTGCSVTTIIFQGNPATDVICRVLVPAPFNLSFLTFYVTPPQSPLKAVDFHNLFTNVFVDPNNQFVTFSGGHIVGSFDFEFEFIGFASNTQVQVLSDVPEPATLCLFATGVGALFTRRKLFARS